MDSPATIVKSHCDEINGDKHQICQKTIKVNTGLSQETNIRRCQDSLEAKTKLLSQETDNNTSSSIYQKIEELNVPILETVTTEQIENFKFFHEKHYENYYFENCNKQGQFDDMCIRVHTNKLLVLGLASGNDIVKCGRKITEIDFIINKGDRSKVNIKGKKKSGARQLHNETVLCKVKLEGEDEMRNIRAGLTGYLIEINEMIKKNPDLLRTDHKVNGYIAIVMPKGPLHDTDYLINNHHLLKEEKYFELLEQRKNNDNFK